MSSQEAALSIPTVLRGVGGNTSKENNQNSSSSKLMMNLQRLTKTKDRLISQVLRMMVRRIKDQQGHDEERYDFTWDDSTCIIRDLAAELNRVVQMNTSLLVKVNEDESCQKERQDFIMQWAEELKKSPMTGQISDGKLTREEPCDQQLTDRDQKLKEASKVLSDWVWTLKGMEQGSVCPGEEVCSVIQDLESQWKKGKLPNMLPVMDFIIWTVLQEHPYEGPMAKQWLRNKQKFRSKVALNHIPESVWKWILKASAKITLDPSTANPSLLLSPYNTALRMGTIIESVYNPWDHCTITSKMYSGWWCVLGSEGFTSGRHYWEVGVKGKSEWRIGVVKESAPRCGFTNLNTQAGYWTLCLQFAELMAVTTPITKLNQFVPSKVGVYLDIEEGQVSFYDAEKRHHIYTFDAKFDKSEKIYPLFHTTETKSELIIL